MRSASSWADPGRLDAANAAVAQAHAASQVPGREGATVAGVAVSTLGVDEEWATRAHPLTAVPAAGRAEVVGWLSARSRRWTVFAQPSLCAGWLVDGLVERWRMPLLATSVRELAAELSTDGSSTAGPSTAGLLIGPVTAGAALAGLHAVYGEEMRPGLVEALVTATDLAAPDAVHLLGTVEGAPVTCATLRLADGVGCISGVATLARWRGRGFGAAVTLAAARGAAERGADTVALHASDRSAPLYRRLGFRPVAEHVALGLPS